MTNPLLTHAKHMVAVRPAGLDREVARELLLREGSPLTVLVIYHTGNEILVFEIQPDAETLSKLMNCHNKYAGDKGQPLPLHATTFITSFPLVYADYQVLDNTDYDCRYHGVTRPISYVFIMGCL